MMPEEDIDYLAQSPATDGHVPGFTLLHANTELRDPESFVTELSAQERFFEARGTARLRIGNRLVAFNIRSVPKNRLEQALFDLRPKHLPKIKRQGQLVVDEEHPVYRQWLLTFGYIKVLLGFAEMTLRNHEGEIVWQSEGEIQDAQAGIDALRSMGITTQHVEELNQHIDALTRLEIAQDEEAFLGN